MIIEWKRVTKRLLKTALYVYVNALCKIDLPYGSLTGVRPTKLLREYLDCGQDESVLVNEYFLDAEKAKLLREVVENQKGIYGYDDKSCDVYINIPICPSRCSYCSFISTELGRVKKRIDEYAESLDKEISATLKIIAEKKYFVRAVYVGGGTPTSLNGMQLTKALQKLKGLAGEFTVECGRADTIDEDRLCALKQLGVTRISVNPQTTNDTTLKLIGRKHTTNDFMNAYKLAKSYGFEINCDLIAGLENENIEDFVNSVNTICSLSPSNITLHALSMKRGSKLIEQGAEKLVGGRVAKMLTKGYQILSQNNYLPYYLYRQKNTADNMENTGYCKKDKQCIYNIDIMEDSITILGVGAGAMSKIVDGKSNTIERFHNPKGFEEYLARLDQTIRKKEDFFNGKPD